MPTKKSNGVKKVPIRKVVKEPQMLPEQIEVTLENKSENPYLIPASVVIAGVLIAGAILFGGNPNFLKSKPKINIAKAMGLDLVTFNECVKNETFATRVQSDREDGEKAGAEGTPFSVVIASSGLRTVVYGAQDYDQVKTIIEESLHATGTVSDTTTPEYAMRGVADTDHLIGNPQAPVKIVEFSDLECPFCQAFHGTMKQVMEEYGPTGQVAWIYRHFPLTEIHNQAQSLALEAECAGAQAGEEGFWTYVDLAFQNQ